MDMVEIRVILVAIDFSDISATVMDYAQVVAAAWQARLWWYTWCMTCPFLPAFTSLSTPLPELQQRLEAEARERLEAACQAAIDPALTYEALIVTGRPVAEIQRIQRVRC